MTKMIFFLNVILAYVLFFNNNKKKKQREKKELHKFRPLLFLIWGLKTLYFRQS